MYDFDKLFADFIRAKGHVHEDEFGRIYEEWFNGYCDALRASPKQVTDAMTDEQLVAELKAECLAGTPSITVMEILEKRAPVDLLIPLLYEDDGNLVFCAAELLRNIGAAPLSVFADMLTSTDDVELFEFIVETLKEDPDSIREKLLELARDCRSEIKTVIAEILSGGGRDERVYQLLSELFASGDNIALYAGYLARYGDERAAAMLYRALDTASYADYMELRNAIEMLGGVVDDYRDFSSDPEYLRIKEKGNDKN